MISMMLDGRFLFFLVIGSWEHAGSADSSRDVVGGKGGVLAAGGTYADMHPLVIYCPHFGGAVGVKQVGQSVSSLRYSTTGVVCAG